MNQNDIECEVSCAIMEVALSLDDADARSVFLERVFENKREAKEEMYKMLEAADGAAEFFLEAREQRTQVTTSILSESQYGRPARLARFRDDIPEMLGHYRLIAPLGEGGGGVVYEAEQEFPIRRRVAIKVVRVDLENKAALARFDMERQALAMMSHPNIAKVFDTGTTPTGKPYFAMELVDGEPITKYCDRHKLSCVERLELFILVCGAIQHAHQKGIIHRDIKPSNVIVIRQDGANIPKIIDFGIAKATDAGAARGDSITAHDQFFGTPAYVSPEQVAMTGIDLDTRSDIFSLGVLLFEMLTGATPMSRSETSDFTLSKVRRSLLSDEPPKPSEYLGNLPSETLAGLAATRGVTAGGLSGFSKGDLDCIVMKAIEKDRAHRYQTANGFAMDIERFLSNQPIIARQQSRLYVLTKLVRRNRFAFGSAVLLMILLVGGFVTTAWLYEREKKIAIEQLRLKNEAQMAREKESRLLKQAEARSNIARTAFLLDQGRIDEADALRKKYPLSSIEPSLEAAAVFRSLGDWNAEHGQWDEALHCFRLLMQANRQDDPQKILLGADLIGIAAATLLEGASEYDEFRNEVIDHYGPSAGGQHAEHILKVCLVRPPEPWMLKKLEPEVSAMGAVEDTPCPPWSALSLALYQLRSGEFENALEACQVGLEREDCKSSCASSLHAVASMAYAKLGQADLAEAAMVTGEKLVIDCNGKDFVAGESIRPFWFDWMISKMLVEEAKSQLLTSIE